MTKPLTSLIRSGIATSLRKNRIRRRCCTWICTWCTKSTSPQAFQGLRERGLRLRAPTKHSPRSIIAFDRRPRLSDRRSYRRQASGQMETNCRDFGVRLFGIGDVHQGIVHVIGPELGLTQPGMTIVCGDSHTATTARSAHSHSASALARSSTSWPRSACCKSGRTR